MKYSEIKNQKLLISSSVISAVDRLKEIPTIIQTSPDFKISIDGLSEAGMIMSKGLKNVSFNTPRFYNEDQYDELIEENKDLKHALKAYKRFSKEQNKVIERLQGWRDDIDDFNLTPKK